MIDEKINRRIGIMGGTFDPVHYGHLMLAEQIRTSFFLDEIVFIPVGIPSHKVDSNGANKYQRLEMTKLATFSNPHFSVSDIEVQREKPTYTIDTVSELKKEKYAHDELFFITGADALLYLDKWKDYEKLIQMVTFVGATRPGVDLSELNEKIESLRLKKAVVDLCYIPALAISSTDIRDRVGAGKSIKYLLPESVEFYIDSHGLYKTHHPRFFELKAHLEKELSPYRFTHSVETAKVARNLALIYGADPCLAEFAGLCHDIAKELPKHRCKALMKAYKVALDPSVLKTPNLAHGEIGAGILRETFSIDEPEVLEAIKWHTYGAESMSLLCKIVYVADIIEPTRDFEGVDHIRHLAATSLEAAMLYYVELSDRYLSEKNKLAHGNTEKMKKILKRTVGGQ